MHRVNIFDIKLIFIIFDVLAEINKTAEKVNS